VANRWGGGFRRIEKHRKTKDFCILVTTAQKRMKRLKCRLGQKFAALAHVECVKWGGALGVHIDATWHLRIDELVFALDAMLLMLPLL